MANAYGYFNNLKAADHLDFLYQLGTHTQTTRCTAPTNHRQVVHRVHSEQNTEVHFLRVGTHQFSHQRGLLLTACCTLAAVRSEKHSRADSRPYTLYKRFALLLELEQAHNTSNTVHSSSVLEHTTVPYPLVVKTADTFSPSGPPSRTKNSNANCILS